MADISKSLIIYESDNLILHNRISYLSVLHADHSVFTDEAGNDIGQVIRIKVGIDSEGNKIYMPKHLKVIQHFPGNYT
jgi:hypothetical protein